MMSALDSPSTRPYLIRALYEWCTDHGLTPYIAVLVDDTVQVPREYVKDGEIVLNISFDATSSLKLGNEFIEFKARFAGTPRQILVPVDKVIAIYARENGQGMAFAVAVPAAASPAPAAPAPAAPAPESRGMQLVPADKADAGQRDDDGDSGPPKPPTGGRPALKRVK
jgi:stringent starvation protein B